MPEQKGYVGYLLSEDSRNHLASLYPPKFPKFIGHHITTDFNVTADAIPKRPSCATVIGYAVDEYSECFVVIVDWRMKRKDRTYLHITWSLDPNHRKPSDCKTLADSWDYIGRTVDIQIEPKFFPFR